MEPVHACDAAAAEQGVGADPRELACFSRCILRGQLNGQPLVVMAAVLYYLGLACLFTHELDAVTHSEWRLLFFLRGMPDDSASPLFVALHVPLFFGVLWLSHHRRMAIRNVTRLAVAAFLVMHAVLHFSLSSNPRYEFHGSLAQALIVSAAFCGFAYLLVQWRSFQRAPSRGEHPAYTALQRTGRKPSRR